MKNTIITLTAIALLAACGQSGQKQNNKKIEAMNKADFDKSNCEIPENTLSVIEAEGRTIYLTETKRLSLERRAMSLDSWYGKAEHNVEGLDFLYIGLTEGCYPADYTWKQYYLQFIREDKVFRLKFWLDTSINYKNGVMEARTIYDISNQQWEAAGYSTDNNLWAKVFEYYQNNVEQKTDK
jgi:hypothetical protein